MPYIFPAWSASQAGPLKSGKAVRGAREVHPTLDSAIPGRSALGEPITLGAIVQSTSRLKERIVHGLKPSSAIFSEARAERPFPVWGRCEHRRADARENKKDAIRERGDLRELDLARGPSWGQGEGVWHIGGGCAASHPHVSCVPVTATHPSTHYCYVRC